MEKTELDKKMNMRHNVGQPDEERQLLKKAMPRLPVLLRIEIREDEIYVSENQVKRNGGC